MASGEKQKLIEKKFGFEGYFNYKHLFLILDTWCREKFYDKEEKRNELFHGPEGRSIEIEFIPWKKVTDYYNIKLKIAMNVDNLKDVTVQRKGHAVKVQHGKVSVKLTGYLVVDYMGQWSKKPLHFFYRYLMDEYVYRHITEKYREMVIDDVNELAGEMEAFLNMAQNKVE